MNQFSTGATFAWEIGAAEAARAKYQYIEIEHIFMGILSLEKIFNQEAIKEKIGDRYNELEPEYLSLEEFARGLDLDMAKLRRAVRNMSLQGDYHYQQKVIHRSEACKAYFLRAEELGKGVINVFSLLAAILEKPGKVIQGVIEEYNLSVEKLRQAVIEKLENVSAKVVSKDGKTVIEKDKDELVWLMRYGRDLVKDAKEGKLMPVEGRNQEMLQLVRTLSRKTKNNPVLVGEAGVGKTAIVEGLAQMIAEGKHLKGMRVIELSMACLVAGTKYRGEFEERLQRVLKEAKEHAQVVLFLDEIHNLVGAGRAEGSMDAADILKPALARGEIKCIGATTIADYRRHIEKDAALERRFQPVMVNEPSAEDSVKILQRLKDKFESHHRVKISDNAIKKAVEFSVRYLPHRQLPDKAIDILDEACAAVQVPILPGRGEELHKTDPGHSGTVEEEVVAEVVSRLTGIPVGKLTASDRERLLNLQDYLAERVKGQEEAVKTVASKIRLAKMSIKDRFRPLGVFLFLGPTGVGKTLLAKTLAQELFSSDKALIRLDMSEYHDDYTVSRLIGAAPGYIGYDEEGQLTGKLRSNPYSVVLLDEIEKADTRILDVFLQLFDEGRITDSKGRTIDAKNAIFIMTSNIMPEVAAKMGFKVKEEISISKEDSLMALRRVMRPEFINRIDKIIVFKPLTPEHARVIAKQQLDELKKQMFKEHGISLVFSEEILDLLVEAGYSLRNGAREIQRTIEQLIKEPLSESMLRFQDSDKARAVNRIRFERDGELVKIKWETQEGMPTQPPDA